MRLDKYITSTTDYSRSEVKKLIKRGDVFINETIAKDASQKIDLENDVVYLDGEPLSTPQARYFMLYKPEDTVCATEDSEHPTVIDLLEEANSHLLHIAGRLDKDTTGLVLITDDGQWSHRVTSPNSGCHKTYRVHLAEAITDKAIQQLENGVQLHHEKRPTLPAKVEVIDPTTIHLTIQEGKYHQIKRMLAAVSNKVEALHRFQIGHLILDSELELGEYRPLTSEEVQGF